MNERIRDLIEQAIGTNRMMSPIENSVPIWTEKFAKLIIQDCIKACQSRVGNSDYNTGRMHCVSDIKDHFRVE